MDGLENVDSFGFGFLGARHKVLVVIAVDDVPEYIYLPIYGSHK